MNLILFLLLSTLIVYLFAQLYPWTGFSTRRSFPEPFAPPQLSRWNPRIRREYQRKQLPTPSVRLSVDIHTLQPGDVVMYRDRDFLVAEQRNVRENEMEWQDYLLEDGYDTFVLSTNDRGDEVFFLRPISDLMLPYPPPTSLDYQHETYTLASKGQAHIDKTNERFRYYTYEGTHHILIAENWGTQFDDIFLGEAVQLRDLTFLPGVPAEKNN